MILETPVRGKWVRGPQIHLETAKEGKQGFEIWGQHYQAVCIIITYDHGHFK